MSKISIIVAMDQNRVIGADNKLPWHISEDLKWFKEKTLNKVIVMGRKTHESIGKKLTKRTNVVISNNREYESPYKDVFVHNSLEEVINKYADSPEIMIIGGAQLYAAAFSFVDRMYITTIHNSFNGDTYFPHYDASNWRIDKIKTIEHNGYRVDFDILDRIGRLV